jgi:hypothetical protein
MVRICAAQHPGVGNPRFAARHAAQNKTMTLIIFTLFFAIYLYY